MTNPEAAFDFNAVMLNQLLIQTVDPKISFTGITKWHSSHPYYRLNYYNDIQISQVLGIYLLFNKDWLSNFDNVIEIGSYNGGLSSYIKDNLKPDAFFVSYDISPEINDVVNKQKRTDIDFRIEDCFSPKAQQEISSYIQQKGKTLMICDGGHKNKEFNLYSQYLKKGDIIILHDFLDDQKTWDTATEYWQWPYGNESDRKSIQESVVKYNLKEYDYDRFQFFIWGSFIKE